MFHVVLHSSIWMDIRFKFRTEASLHIFKTDFLQETKQKLIPEADYYSLVEFYDNLQQELKQRALPSYPNLKNLETDELGCALNITR